MFRVFSISTSQKDYENLYNFFQFYVLLKFLRNFYNSEKRIGCVCLCRYQNPHVHITYLSLHMADFLSDNSRARIFKRGSIWRWFLLAKFIFLYYSCYNKIVISIASTISYIRICNNKTQLTDIPLYFMYYYVFVCDRLVCNKIMFCRPSSRLSFQWLW